MTDLEKIEELKSKLYSLNTESKRIYDEIKTIEAELCELSPLKVGNRIRITRPPFYSNREPSTHEAFVSRVFWSSGQFSYTFKAVKKDGTMSANNAGIYSLYKDDKIEIIS